MKKRPVFYLVLGIIILLVPTSIYLVFLVPKLTQEYNILMASGGIIGGFGFYGASKIPEKLKYSGLFKTSANAFTAFTVITIVQKFIVQLIGLCATFLVSFIIFKLLMEAFKNAKQRIRDAELAKEIARNINEASK